MKKPTEHQRIANEMNKLREGIEDGSINRSIFAPRKRLSHKILRERLRTNLTNNSILSDPHTYASYRALKFACEGIDLCEEEIAEKFKGLINTLKVYIKRNPWITSPSELANDCVNKGKKLYKEIRSLPYSPYIFRWAGLNKGRQDYYYFTDAELLCEAAKFNSFTELKYGNDALHRHIKSRSLKNELIRTNPKYANHFYVGIGELLYRSIPELVVGNYLLINKISVEHEYNTHLKYNIHGKPIIADYLLNEPGIIIEVLQNTAGDGGGRRAAYASRRKAKINIYKRHHIKFIEIDSDNFYERGVFKAGEFAHLLHDKVLQYGYDIGAPPPAKFLQKSNNALKQKLITGTQETVFEILKKNKVTGIADLQNHHSQIHNCLRIRDDFEEIHKKIIAASRKRMRTSRELRNKNARQSSSRRSSASPR